jgi:hypothetical protein
MLIAPEISLTESGHKTHPWSRTSYTNGGGAYYDFTKNLNLIPEVLEDFRPHADQQAVQRFYEFLGWVNGDESLLETTDCALRAPHEHEDSIFRARLKIDGRLEILYREHAFNVAPDSFRWLEYMFCLYLQVYRPDFYRAVIRIGARDTDYVRLPPAECHGKRLCLTFNAYGDSEAEAFDSLLVVFEGFWGVSKRISNAMTVAVPDFP